MGAFAFEYLLHEFKDLPAIGGFNTGKHWQLWMGLFIVAVVVYAPRGLLGLLERVLRARSRTVTEALLSARQLTRRFGGLAAVNDVTLDLWRAHPRRDRPQRRGQVHADQPALGRPRADHRQRHAGRARRHRLEPERISRAGLGRSYQKTNIFLPFTVWENIRLAASRTPHAAGWLRLAGQVAAANERAERALELAGLQERRQHIAGAASRPSSASSRSR